MLRLLILMASCGVLTGCEIKKREPLHCQNDICIDAGSAAGVCTTSSECPMPALPACDTDQHVCVTCFGDSHALCKDNTPRCDHDTCVACADDTRDCQGGVCLLTGACAGADNILHAIPNMVGGADCSASKPCTLEKALMQVTATKNVIKLDSSTTPYMPDMKTFTVNADVTIDMRNAILHPNTAPNMDGPILVINGGKTVTVLGGTIDGSNNADGIVCNGNLTIDGTTITMTDRSGINAANNCNLNVTHSIFTSTSVRPGQFAPAIFDQGDSLTLSRSTFLNNHGGGIVITSGRFAIIGNAFSGNGGDSSPNGAISITAPDSSNRIEFNTIIGNGMADSGKAPGIDCNAGIGSIGRNNIVWNNKQKTAGTAIFQVSGVCKHTYSGIGPTPVPTLIDGLNNFSTDPHVVNEQNDLRLKSDSMAIGYADPAADLMNAAAKDINDEPRVKRDVGNKGADIGAYQYRAP
jgi:hypothetical protein